MSFEGLNLGIGEIVFIEISDILEKLQPLLCKQSAPSYLRVSIGPTIVEEKSRKAPGLLVWRIKRLLEHAQKRLAGFIASDVEEPDCGSLRDGHGECQKRVLARGTIDEGLHRAVGLTISRTGLGLGDVG